ncbi:MAG: antibiotic biosynthesis monooxygenase [Anaerolineales bacterium]
MVEIIWQFVVREECRGQFELAYGPGGAWSKLFSDSPGFRGTALLRDEDDPKRYLTVDMWDSVGQRERWLFERKDEYTKTGRVN